MEKILLFNNKWKITIQTLKKQKMIFIRANLWIREDLAYKNWKKMTSTYQILLLISSVMKITVRKNFDFFCPEFNFIGLFFLELTINAYFIDKEKRRWAEGNIFSISIFILLTYQQTHITLNLSVTEICLFKQL